MVNHHTAVLCEFIAKFNFISKPFNYNIHFLEVVSIFVNTFLQSLVEIMHHSLQNDWRNCCHFIPNVLCCTLLLFIHLALEISPDKEVTGVENGRSCRPFSIPSVWHHASWEENLVEGSHCILCSVSCCPVLLKP